MERKRREVTYGSGRGKELRGEGLVPVVLEHQVRSGERRRGLAGGLGPRRALGDLVQRPRRVHVLRPLPALVVGVAIAKLAIYVHTPHQWVMVISR
jgi:hypothetical protein